MVIQTRMHTQSYLPPYSRIRSVGKGIRATTSVQVGKRCDLKYAAIWRVSASGEIISCTDGSHWLTWKLRLDAQARAKENALLIRGRIGGNPARASPSTYHYSERELELAALAMQPLDASEHE